MCHSTGYGFCLSESGTGDLQISVSVWNRVYFLPCDSGTCGRGYFFGARIVLPMNVVAVTRSGPSACLLNHAISESKVNRVSHFSVWNRVNLFSRFCLEQGSKIVSL